MLLFPLSAFSDDVSWDRPYLGFSVGRVFGDASNYDLSDYNNWSPTESVGEYGTNGAVFGFKMGKNWLINNSKWLVGTELEIGRLQIDNSKQLPRYMGVRLPTDSRAYTHNGNFIQLSQKFGRLLTNDFLVFGKVGYIGTSVQQEFRDDDAYGCLMVAGQKTEHLGGPILGLGAEFMIKNNLSARLDYTHYGFGSATNRATACVGNNNYDFKHTLDLDSVQLGLSYYF